jgi:hypothetical protein
MKISEPLPTSAVIGSCVSHVVTFVFTMQSVLIHKHILSAVMTADAPARCAVRTYPNKLNTKGVTLVVQERTTTNTNNTSNKIPFRQMYNRPDLPLIYGLSHALILPVSGSRSRVGTPLVVSTFPSYISICA